MSRPPGHRRYARPSVSAVYWGNDFHALYNDAYALALAERHPAVLGKPLREVWPEIWDVLSAQVRGVVDTGRGFTTSHQPLILLKNGEQQETFWVYTFAPLRLEDGTVGGCCFVTALETTRQIFAERALEKDRDGLAQVSIALRSSEQQLQQLNANLEAEIASRITERDRLWKNARDMQVVADKAGNFVAVNPAVTTILGWLPEEVIGHNTLEFIHTEDLVSTQQAIAQAASNKMPIFENRYRHKGGGYRTISWVAAPEQDLIFASGRNVTDERRRDAELADSQQRACASHRSRRPIDRRYRPRFQ